jgi:hypothetical protein
MNKYLIIGALVLLGIVSFQSYQLKKADNKIDRLSDNFTELQESNTKLRLTVSEFKEYSSDRMDSILEVASVKPKWVKEYTTVNNHYYDTTVVEVPVEQVDTFKYSFIEANDCFTVGGIVNIKDSIPQVEINHREFTDTLNIIKYIKPNKFWFIRSGFLFGKSEELEIVGNCGIYEYENIQVVKD